MGSSNAVRVAVIEESTYGTTPGSGNFSTARFTSESLSGTPNTVESKQIRVDRMSSGQVVVGLAVAGQLQFELAKESPLDMFLESAMQSSWDTFTPQVLPLEIDASAKTLTRATGDWQASGQEVYVGDFVTLSGFKNSENNTQVMISEIVSALVVKYIGVGQVTEVSTQTFTAATTDIATKATHGLSTGARVKLTTTGTLPAGLALLTDYYLIVLDANTFKFSDTLAHAIAGTNIVDITDTGTGTHSLHLQATYQRADKLTIGTTKKSFSMEKAFTDLTTKAINYRGMIVSNLDLKFAYGELATGSLGFSGNDYEPANSAGEFMTNSRTIDAAATTQTLNGSVDMPFLASSATGVLAANSFDLQSVSIKLNNNLKAIEVIGDIAPIDYSSGTAQVNVDLSAYLTDSAWALLENKLEQDPFSIAFQVKNSGGWYAVYMPQVQVSFSDPVSGGQNQDIVLGMTGTAKVGASGESALSLFRG